ncbi:copper radical oxidase [Amanita thiersii Skay4041]|uniref:Copper radical oxidase n=1 Tax=Amanita thiersii Skay4041 TaxID=703135 RepID=A0A2A9NZM2_9AGAR|nr:copper radical oxidase [Amanita thiersii Skay4041]
MIPPPRSLLLTFFSICPFYSLIAGRSEIYAWNGHVDPASRTPRPFTNFYVPPGAKGYDSSSPLVHYKGQWSYHYSPRFAHKTLHSTSDPNADVRFTFFGTGIEWFGNTDKHHGIVNVFIDGKLFQEVNCWSPHDIPQTQQRLFWNYELPFGKHTLKLTNAGPSPGSTPKPIMDVDAFVVTCATNPVHIQQTTTSLSQGNVHFSSSLSITQVQTKWDLFQKGSSGVSAMQLVIISPTHAIIIDKVEHNPLTISGHPAWAALYNLETHAVRALHMQSNSFCAGGTFLGNGTLINIGGNPIVETHTSSADFGDLNGLQAIRIFEPCDTDTADGCEMIEDHSRIRMASPRWYPTVIRISDGSAMIIGGSKKGGWINNATVNNPTIEYFPPKSIHDSKGLPIHMPFLVDSLNANLFPIAFFLPKGRVFIAANRDAMMYDWISNTEYRLPRIPNGVRVTYPMTGAGLLLPLSPENDYAAEILICGGSTIDDHRDSYKISSQEAASAQCVRMLLTESGISSGWQVEHMPEARTMGDAVLLPTGEILIVNGAGAGISGYGNVKDQIGESNADKPVFTPLLYRPNAPSGERFSRQGLIASNIPRMYHSVATLTPNGQIMIAGSNPNLDRSELPYGTDYRVEWIIPPYMAKERPKIVDGPKKILYGEDVQFTVNLSSGLQGKVRVAIMDFGFVTHAVHANSRLVYLKSTLEGDQLKVTGPPNGNIYPPGPGYLFLIIDDIPSQGVKIMIGDGRSPYVDQEALKK